MPCGSPVATVVLQFISPRRYSIRCSSQCRAQGSKRICTLTEIEQCAKAWTQWRRCAAIGITRTDIPTAAAEYRERLGEDKGLSRQQALRAITINSSYELHQDTDAGSLEPGKLADLIVLDRNVIEIPVDQIAETHVVQTVVGGHIVYSAGDMMNTAVKE